MAEAEREKILQNKIKQQIAARQSNEIVDFSNVTEGDEDLKLLKRVEHEEFNSQSSLLTVKHHIQKMDIEHVNCSTGNGRFHVKDTWSSYTKHD